MTRVQDTVVGNRVLKVPLKCYRADVKSIRRVLSFAGVSLWNQVYLGQNVLVNPFVLSPLVLSAGFKKNRKKRKKEFIRHSPFSSYNYGPLLFSHM